MKQRLSVVAFAAIALSIGQAAWAGEAEAKKWIDSEFQPSTLSKEQQMAEMKWFIEAAKKLQAKGVKEISVVSETITTHEYESKTLARAFTEITGIKVNHDLIQEGDVVEKLQTSMQSGKSIYDGWISDSDLIGTHYRYGKILPLTDYMNGPGKEFTNPGLDLKDFIGLSFTTAPDGKVYQLPDQQFANLYWFRADLFERPDLKEKFKAKYGYELGVPLNWSAYEDIAEFFTNDVKTIDGKPIYGHMDYGKKDPSLGWRFTDAWLSMAGAADRGIPNGLPVDEWGIRVADDKCTPVGASVQRGGATNSPAAVYALTKYVDWLKKYAPKEAMGMTFSEAGPVPAQGQIAQQIFWYTAFTADMTKPGLPVVNPDGTPKWRMAPSPYGPYWKDGMQNGYQDVGAWTFFKNHDPNRLAAAWLYAQFVTSKTVSLKKTIVGLTPIRESDIQSQAMTEMAPKLGGLVEFYRSPARVAWTPTGNNVPDYPKLAQLWWKHVATAVTGERTPQQAMDNLAEEMDQVMARLERAGMENCPPKLNKKQPAEKWLSDTGAPWKKLANEKPKGETIAYDKLLAAWREGRKR
ncbi:carbohydrate ABC transporter substrate-binding protein [Caldimonas thermodepolymerans]|uniref:ABC transporter substrate-binding protein n=1 Tax=Caldimonas thermodepolymerans TaxID=215580 RepID=A0A2S5T7Y4_9BURK|nr:ABC transporter substrate-binding protein [Caldimonas thermodepolymerans]PPE71032.1 ABC transporter substrate-binding protein [Caldimonas thermodepolymerans]QPC31332.1 carbohydrate ABC transporter substrate-binding protein [Caldimonas thermodepolymerans]RDH99703.1 carbohydrate ABC transporter substrate-binding protein (CUT1 family) [Caldimonas thermodepolymerans]TCP07571.1 carbohydrate ABC transporter substrate-binding protein (CUT1 family) [Caldimonas thermodepolymerans]UZG47742.1 ABC tran